MNKFILLFFILIAQTAIAQESVEIHGRVLSKAGSYADGAVIGMKETKAQLKVDACGEFRIRLSNPLKGHLTFSYATLNFSFDLKNIKSEDLGKEIVFKLMYEPEKKDDEEEVVSITMECNETGQQKVVFELKKDK